ncbi:MAG: hypothetical protein AB7F93_09840 [Immundisolibacter sp.]|uniref:hypothetical protein n=1 Tax=Immundisolibacter sp. TaxID=1934948 RepID=UPI003D0D4F7E
MNDPGSSDRIAGAQSPAGPAAVVGRPQAAQCLPAAFVPAWPHPAWWQRPVWFATRAGRLRLALAGARRAGDAACKALATGYERLQQRPMADPATQRWFIDQLLCGLTWIELRRQRCPQAAQWLARFDPTADAGPATFALRWELMTALHDAGQAQALLEQAAQFVADPLAVGSVDAVQRTLDWVHRSLSSRGTLALLDAMLPALSGTPWAMACRAVCECPPCLDSAAQAQQWTERARPGELGFSDSLQAQALVIAARAAEWAGRHDSMFALVATARRLDPTHEDVHYWQLRAALHWPGRAEAPRGTTPDTPPWRRLQAMLAVDRDANLPSARALLGLLDDDLVRTLEAPEGETCLRLLQRVLRVDPAWDDAVLEPTAELCRRVSRCFGGQAWSECTLAFAELRLRADYQAAWARLHGWRGHPSAELAQLSRVARVLAGDSPACEDLLALAREADAIEPAWVDALPALRTAREILALAHRAIAHDSGTAEGLRALLLPAATPAWARWVALRTALLALGPQGLPVSLVDTPDAAVAWEFEFWAAEVAPEDLGTHAAVAAGRRRLDALEASAPEQQAWIERLAALRAARADPLSAPGDDRAAAEPATPALARLFDIGGSAAATFAAEIAIEQRYRVARRALRLQHLREAADCFDALEHELSSARGLTRALWLPLVVYWRGVAAARLGDPDAQTRLESLQGGCMAARARAQLAMLAIRQGDLDRAASCLRDVPDGHAAARYARALLHERRGDLEAALLVSGDAHERQGASPYAAAQQRLHAALLERTGRTEAARAAYEARLVADPADAVCAARLLRIRSRQRYPHGRTGGPGMAALFESAARVAWVHGYVTLDRLTAPEPPGPAAPASEAHACAWALLRARALVSQGRPGEALCELRADAPEHRRALAILRTQQLLASLWPAGPDDTAVPAPPPGGPADLRCCADELAGLEAQRSHDREVARWQRLARAAADWLASDADRLDADAWQALAPSALAWTPGLFAADESQRRHAASAALQAMIDGNGADDLRHDLVAAIGHRILGHVDTFLECCERLFPSLAQLPVDGAQLWLAAAALSCQRDGWRLVLDSQVPASLADLSHPGVRMALACAYAQAAVDQYEDGKSDDARKHLGRARQALEALTD